MPVLRGETGNLTECPFHAGQSQPPQHLSMFLEVSDSAAAGNWSCFVSHRLAIVNQRDSSRSLVKESQVDISLSCACGALSHVVISYHEYRGQLVLLCGSLSGHCEPPGFLLQPHEGEPVTSLESVFFSGTCPLHSLLWTTIVEMGFCARPA